MAELRVVRLELKALGHSAYVEQLAEAIEDAIEKFDLTEHRLDVDIVVGRQPNRLDEHKLKAVG